MMVRGAAGVAESVNFYQNALGMTVIRHTDDFAELVCGVSGTSDDSSLLASISSSPSPTSKIPPPLTSQTSSKSPTGIPTFRISIKSVEDEACLSHGYTPFLSFDVDDMDSTIVRCLQMGGRLDGSIQYPAHGKVAALRAPDGHMIGLYEPTS